MSILTTVQHSTGSPSLSNQATKRNKGIQIKEEVKLSVFADDLILYVKNLKDPHQKTIKLIIEFSKVIGCKINVQKSVSLLYTNHKTAEREIKE